MRCTSLLKALAAAVTVAVAINLDTALVSGRGQKTMTFRIGFGRVVVLSELFQGMLSLVSLKTSSKRQKVTLFSKNRQNSVFTIVSVIVSVLC